MHGNADPVQHPQINYFLKKFTRKAYIPYNNGKDQWTHPPVHVVETKPTNSTLPLASSRPVAKGLWLPGISVSLLVKWRLEPKAVGMIPNGSHR